MSRWEKSDGQTVLTMTCKGPAVTLSLSKAGEPFDIDSSLSIGLSSEQAGEAIDWIRVHADEEKAAVPELCWTANDGYATITISRESACVPVELREASDAQPLTYRGLWGDQVSDFVEWLRLYANEAETYAR